MHSSFFFGGQKCRRRSVTTAIRIGAGPSSEGGSSLTSQPRTASQATGLSLGNRWSWALRCLPKYVAASAGGSGPNAGSSGNAGVLENQPMNQHVSLKSCANLPSWACGERQANGQPGSQ